MKSPTIITGRMVLLGILGFFGVIFAVNGAFVYFALDSWPGLSNDSAYEQGLDYNQTIAAAEAQNATGWQSAVSIEKEQGYYAVSVHLKEANGEPLSGQKVTATFRRPVGAENTIVTAMLPMSDGVYANRVELPFPGRWQVFVEVETGEAISYRMQHEVLADQ